MINSHAVAADLGRTRDICMVMALLQPGASAAVLSASAYPVSDAADSAPTAIAASASAPAIPKQIPDDLKGYMHRNDDGYQIKVCLLCPSLLVSACGVTDCVAETVCTAFALHPESHLIGHRRLACTKLC